MSVRLKYVLIHKIYFAAAHFLEGLPPDQRGRPHKCSNMHGHSWQAEFQLSACNLDQTGLVFDFDVMDGFGRSLDHGVLNEIIKDDGGKLVNPTSENVARFLYDSMNRVLLATDSHLDVFVDRVSVMESCDSRVDLLREVSSS